MDHKLKRRIHWDLVGIAIITGLAASVMFAWGFGSTNTW